MKKPLYLLIMFVLMLTGCTSQKEVEPMPEECENTNAVTLDQTATLDAAFLWQHSVSCEGLQYKDNTLQLKEGFTEATLLTAFFTIPASIELVPSWNIQIDDTVKVRIKIIPQDETQTSLMMGYWTKDYKMSLSSQANDVARVGIDTLIPTTELTSFAFLIEFEEGQFELKNLSFTTKPVNDTFDLNEDLLEDISLSVPPFQQLSIPTIGSSICSPTSLAMVLSYYAVSITPSLSAGMVYDEGAQIYGNWSFNASVAGGYEGLYSRVEYIPSIATIVDYLSNDIPIILSIKTTNQSDLDGSIMAYPAGHLLVLTGLTQQDGSWYALVNDPAEYTNDAVPRMYPLDQLLSAWRGYTYIITNSPL